MSCSLSSQQIEAVTSFHGHWCPGLAIGIRAGEWALSEMGRSGDEEIVAVVETDMCGVDAIQYLTGCTFGKGNLIYRDFGKNAFTFYRRSDGRAARLVTRPEVYGDIRKTLSRLHAKMQDQGLTTQEEQELGQARSMLSRRIMEAPLEDVFEIKVPEDRAPRKARILNSQTCETCGEQVMETRTRRIQGQTLCIPCFERFENPAD